MPWYFPWSDNIKKRSCRYLLQRYLGQFLEEKLTLDQLSVDLYNGTGSVSDVSLDVQALNELGEQHNWPIEFVDGFISEISVSIPWASLLSESSVVEINGLNLVIQPKERLNPGVSMFESVWSSMTSSSIQIAEECLKQTSESEQSNPLEGLDVFVHTIDSILTRVKLSFTNTFVRLEYLPRDKSLGSALELHVKRFSYFDEAGGEEIPEGSTVYSCAFVTKNFVLEGITAYTNEFHINNRTISRYLLTESTTFCNKDEKAEIFGAKKVTINTDSIIFAKMMGRQEIRLKVKQAENISGPKINVEVNMSSLALFISPRQLCTICDVVYGLIMPNLQDNSNIGSSHFRFHQKPMNSFDFEKVEQELIQHVNPTSVAVNSTRCLQNTSGWTSGGLAYDSDDDFQSIKGAKAADSLASSVSSVGSSASNHHNGKTEPSTSRYQYSKSRGKLKGNVNDSDTNGDVNVYSMRMNSLSIVLLHRDLLRINSSTKLPESDSIIELKNAANQFFVHLSSYLTTSGYGHKGFESSKKIFLDAVCRRNHFRLMSTTILLSCEEKNDLTELKMESTLSLADVEVIECLVPSEDDSSVQYIELLCFTKNPAAGSNHIIYNETTQPNIVVRFKYITNLKRYTIPRQIDLKVIFQRCCLELDITMIDRLHDVITNLRSFYAESSKAVFSTENTYKDTGFQTMLDVPYTETKLDWNCTFPLLLIKFRFPVPDVRPVCNINESAWWIRNIYDDILLIELSNVSMFSSLTSHQVAWSFEVHSKSFSCSFQHSKSESPVQFISSCTDERSAASLSSNEQDFSFSRLVLKIYPKVSYIDLEDDVERDIMAQSVMDSGGQESSPFSSKKVMRESGTHSDGSQYSCSDGEQIILPGSKEEISDFIEDASRNARIQAEISIPAVVIQIPSKHFVELLYNRFSNNLLLWIPNISKLAEGVTANPLSSNKSDAFYTGFSACRSDASCNSDNSDDELKSDGFFGSYEKNKTSKKPNDYNACGGNQSKLTICLFVAQGVLNVYPNARDSSGNVIPGQHGELQVLFDEANLFNVVNHKGRSQLNFICLQVNHASLYHSSLIPEGVGFEIKSVNSYPSKHLTPVIYRTSPGCVLNESTPVVGTGSTTSDDMLTLAVKVSTDKIIKNICVANSVCCGTLRYRSQSSYNSWLIQLINFFDVKDYPVPHYQPMKVVTQLYQQFVNCVIDYRPLYLPYKAAIYMENFNVSSNITAETSTSVLRFIAEEVSLFLSHKTEEQNAAELLPSNEDSRDINLLNDYVCVLDFGLFELSLRLTNDKKGSCPRVDLRASNNVFHIRTCSDSAVALMELLKYVALDGDTRNDNATSSSTNESSNHSGVSDVLVALNDPHDNQQQDLLMNDNVLSSSPSCSAAQTDDINRVSDLMEEAINDVQTSVSLRKSKSSAKRELRENEELFFFPDEEHQAAMYDVDGYNNAMPTDSDDDDTDDYCMIDEVENLVTLYSQKVGVPEIRLVTNDTIRVVDNHFTIPTARADALKAPEGYPSAVARYTLREMTIVWHMYGGHDFQLTRSSSSSPKHLIYPEKDKIIVEPSVTFEANHSRYSSSDSVNTLHSTINENDLSAINVVFRKRHRSDSSSNSYTGSYNNSPIINDKLKVPAWKIQGGVKREHDVLMELQLSKLKFQYEVYPDNTKQACRYVLLIQEVEIRDRLASSNINKFLYQYYSTARPKRSNANMVVLKATNIRPEINVSTRQECCLRLSLLPLRLNIDQDSLLFLVKFMTDISGSSSNSAECTDSDSSGTSASSSLEKSPQHQAPVMNIENARYLRSSPSVMIQLDDKEQFSSVPNSPSLFIRSFVFFPDVPVRIDYEGKRVDMSHGPIAGLIMGLGQLSCSELKLKSICNRHGFLGIDKLISYVLTEWLQDIKKKQLPSILGGVGPMYSLVQLFQGIRDLFWLPIEQYQRDGRIVRGLQRGANSFTTSTAMAALELTSRIVYAIQRIAETAFDIVSPGPSIRYLQYDVRSGKKDRKIRRYKYGQPADIREGVTTALLLVKEGFGETAQTLVRVASKEHEVKGTVGAVGGVLRQIPSTALTPIIIASQATSNVLSGVKSQLIPDARNEAALKWRNDCF